mmetsp:Transcript_12973/g.31629  ORF Transcript_12973/g.31629 Transcript_12973/m.31629 type:complete len:214 (-) Transcript_12973:2104-2745(-)
MSVVFLTLPPSSLVSGYAFRSHFGFHSVVDMVVEALSSLGAVVTWNEALVVGQDHTSLEEGHNADAVVDMGCILDLAVEGVVEAARLRSIECDDEHTLGVQEVEEDAMLVVELVAMEVYTEEHEAFLEVDSFSPDSQQGHVVLAGDDSEAQQQMKEKRRNAFERSSYWSSCLASPSLLPRRHHPLPRQPHLLKTTVIRTLHLLGTHPQCHALP